MRFFIYKDFRESLAELNQRGGLFSTIANRVYAIWKKIDERQADPFNGIPLTNHGENRIKHCWKYDLHQGCRLITICDNNMQVLCFVGTHDDCDKWLTKKRGFTLTVNKNNQLEEVLTSQDISVEERRINTAYGRSNDLIIEKISGRFIDRIATDVPFTLLRKFSELKSTDTVEMIEQLAEQIVDEEKKIVFFDVLCKLREDDVEGAKKSIDVYLESQIPIEVLQPEEVETLEAGDSFIDIDDLTPELFEHFVKTAPFQKWMLFLHPDQKKIVERNFSGPAKLVGVSGSGKTCIIVKRAVYLAEQYPGEKILILTLNRSLARLIRNLINHVCPSEDRNRIEVYSFWEFCQINLKHFEPHNERLYDEMTWKTNEYIDEVWAEYYECKLNNHDAKILTPVNKSLIVRGVYPKDYVRQEFDWIRSALPREKRNKYYELDRVGRAEPFARDFREAILKGLESWEDKMEFVGVIDYLGLSNALHRHKSELKPIYRCVLVDEVQDFGTIELEIIRQLAAERENDIFLCGDVAQQVYSKHHKILEAGINISGRALSIKKNYRNSREILGAAYCLLKENMAIENLKTDEFEILEPEYANFSTPKPLILKSLSLDEEFGSCMNYLKKNINSGQKACIAICGYSIYDIKSIGESLNLPVLDGNASIDNNNIFLSDLEQTKGFEFDVVCIINCNQNVIPNPVYPRDEWYREICRFYVAMTRAKLSLILSYSAELSMMLQNCRDTFQEASWQDHEEDSLVDNFELPVPMVLQNEQEISFSNMTGFEFLHTRKAVGISRELADKMDDLISGQSVLRNGRPTQWKNIGTAYNERDIPAIAQLFGAQKTYPEFKELFKGLPQSEG